MEIINSVENCQTKRISRRITLRNKKKQYNTYLRSLPILHTTPFTRSQHFLKIKQNKTIRHCNLKYGFTANPNHTHWTNCKHKISQLPTTKYFNDNITNLTFHNLCINQTLPPGTRHLLGLGHKFIPQRSFPNPLPLSTFQDFNRNVRLKYAFAGIPSDPLTKNDRKIYIRSDWTPELGNDDLEQRLADFQREIQKITIDNRSLLKKPTFNLSRLQHRTLKVIKNNPHIIIILADKNLGPVVMDRNTYIEKTIKEHLSDKQTYERLKENDANFRLQELNEQLTYLFENPSAGVQNSLSEIEQKYFARSLHQDHRIPTFYGLAKIHKQPWTLRPVVSCCGSLLAAISTWIDFHLQKLRNKLPTFITDSTDFQKELTKVKIPKYTRICTCDAISMYTNIDVDHSIDIVRQWFIEFKDEIPTDIPTNLLITALEIVMKNNIFTFGDTFWQQKTGTAMGTPCACMLASIYFAYHERTLILPKYKQNIIFYKRFIDDVFCLWNDDLEQTNLISNNTFANFQSDMNNFGKLKWEFEELTHKTTFLDLNITLVEKPHPNRTTHDFYKPNFSTYQKPMNLYLYIPPQSAHPPGVIKSLIHSQIKKYWHQNTNSDDFIKITRAFFQRLIALGHNHNKIKEIFLQTAKQLDNDNEKTLYNETLATNKKTINTTYIKWRFHPTDINRKTIQHIYSATCERPTELSNAGFRDLPTETGERMHIDKLTIAFTRDKNIRDLLIPSRLRTFPNFPNYNVSHHLNSIKGDDNKTNDNET